MSAHTLSDGRVLTLRPPTLEDAAMLVEYPKRVGAETDFLYCDENGIAGLTLEGERDYIQTTLDMPCTKMFLGFVDGELVSVSDIRALGRPRIAHNGELAISVVRDFWRLGVGSILMREMIDFARGTGTLENLCLSARADNARAIALYTRFGFRPCGRYARRICVRGEYFDELLMELKL